MIRRSYDEPDAVGGRSLRVMLRPWRWSAMHLFGLAAVNAAFAIGIAVGFSPKPLR